MKIFQKTTITNGYNNLFVESINKKINGTIDMHKKKKLITSDNSLIFLSPK